MSDDTSKFLSMPKYILASKDVWYSGIEKTTTKWTWRLVVTARTIFKYLARMLKCEK
jgi:hypothetical protein